MIRALALSLCMIAPPLFAQQAALVGQWKVKYPAGARMEDGVVTQLVGTGTLTVTIEADSLVAVLVLDPSPDIPPRTPLRLAGATAADEVMFQGRSTGSVRINGDERPITILTTWKVRAQGDSLLGMVERKVDGGPMGPVPPQPISGTRLKS